MARVRRFVRGLSRIVISSVVLILLALVYFIVTAWIVSFGVETVMGSTPSADFVALSAALLSLGSLAGSSYSMGNQPGPADGEGDYGVEVA